MECIKCGTQLREDAKFCPKCGQKVERSYSENLIKEEQNICPKCGIQNKPGALFCKNCGHKFLKENKPVQKPESSEKMKPVQKPESSERMKPVRKPESSERMKPVRKPEAVKKPNPVQKKKSGKKKSRLLPILILGLFLALILGGVVCVATDIIEFPGSEYLKSVLPFGDEKNDDAEDEDKKENLTETEEAQESETQESESVSGTEEIAADSSSAETQINTGSNNKEILTYTGVDTFQYPLYASDYTEIKSSDGKYSFKYPKNMFKEGYFDPSTENYYLSTANEEITISIKKQSAPIENDPLTCANFLLSQKRKLFVEGTDTPYIHQSKAVAESGYSRTIIAGQLQNNTSKGQYILHACNNQDVYVMTITYPFGGTAGTGVELSPCGYLLDCMYRGWSISGSTYELRDYDTYLNGKMGTKKAD